MLNHSQASISWHQDLSPGLSDSTAYDLKHYKQELVYCGHQPSPTQSLSDSGSQIRSDIGRSYFVL